MAKLVIEGDKKVLDVIMKRARRMPVTFSECKDCKMPKQEVKEIKVEGAEEVKVEEPKAESKPKTRKAPAKKKAVKVTEK